MTRIRFDGSEDYLNLSRWALSGDGFRFAARKAPS